MVYTYMSGRYRDFLDRVKGAVVVYFNSASRLVTIIVLVLLLGILSELAVSVQNTTVSNHQDLFFDSVAPHPAILLAAPLSVPEQVNPDCIDLVQGGNFETPNDSAWERLAGLRQPTYSTDQTFNGSAYSLRLGNSLDAENVESISEARHIPIVLPADATSIILRFRYWPLIDGTMDEYDLQQADIFDAATEQLLDQPMLVRDNAQSWKLVDRDLTWLAGRQISLRFRVRNNGLGARMFMYIDNVEIEYCPAPDAATLTPSPTTYSAETATPTATTVFVTTTSTPAFVTETATPTATPTSSPLPSTTGTLLPTATEIYATVTPTFYYPPVVPTGVVPTADPSCTNILADPSFEELNGWNFGQDPIPPRYVSAPVRSGLRAVQLGNPPGQPTNVESFSSVRQLVTLPYNITRAELRWWKQLHTEQPGDPNMWSDRQDLILLSPSLQPITILRREWSNSPLSIDWQEDVEDITAFRGQSFYVYFNAYNDGAAGRTWMFLDDVQLNICGYGGNGVPISKPYLVDTPVAIPLTSAPTETPAPLPTPSPFPTLFVTATPLPTMLPTMTALPSATATALVVTPAEVAMPNGATSPTPNAYGVPDLPQAVVVDNETPTTTGSNAVITVAPPAVAPTQVSSGERPLWMDRLGPIAVLVGILLLIVIIIIAIVRTFRTNQAP